MTMGVYEITVFIKCRQIVFDVFHIVVLLQNVLSDN